MIRGTRYSLMLILISILLLTVSSSIAFAGDWPTFHYDATNSGYTNDVGPSSDVVAWRYKIGTAIDSSPTIQGDTLYVGADDAALYALDKNDGSLLWSYQTGSGATSTGIEGSPVISKGKVIFGSKDHTLYSLDASSGSLNWKKVFENWLETTPAVSDGKIFTEGQISLEEYFCCLDEISGNILWKTDLNGASCHSSPAVYNGVVYVGMGFARDELPGGLYAFDAGNGSIKWKFHAGDGDSNADVDMAPCVAYGKVFFGSNYGTLYALYEDNGDLVWSVDGNFKISSPAAYDNNIFIASQSTMHAFNSLDGTELWTFNAESVIDSSPAIAKGIIYFGSDDGYLYALDAATGGLKWKYKTGDAIDSSPAVSGDMVFFGSDDGYIYAIGKNLGPKAVIHADRYDVDMGNTVNFDGSDSSDPNDGSVNEYFFNFGDGQNSGWITDSFVSHKYNTDGVFKASLKVKDINDLESSFSHEIEINVSKGSMDTGTTSDTKESFDDIMTVLIIIVVIVVVIVVLAIILKNRKEKKVLTQSMQYYQTSKTQQTAAQPPPQQQTQQQYKCMQCNSPLRYIPDYQKYYCDKCQKYN